MKALLVLILLVASTFSAAAATLTPDVSILSTVTASISAAATNILPQATWWLSALMSLQFAITNFSLLKDGSDIEVIVAKFIGLLAWFGFCFYILNNGPDFINSVGTDLLQKFTPNIPGPGSIITATLGMCTTLLIAIGLIGTSVVGMGNSSLAMVLVYVLFIIFFIGMYMAIKVFMLGLELSLIVMLSPLSFAFLGMNALKDQGIAPFKSLISLAYRIILLGVIFTAFSKIMGVGSVALNGINWANPLNYGTAINIIFSTMTAFPLLAYLVYKSDSIAASLAGGSTNMGPGDVASAAAAGAAAGAAVASGGASLAGAATKIPQSMGDMMKGLSGGSSGSVSNASSRGTGPTPVGTPPPARPVMSTNPNGLPTNAAGYPMKSPSSGGYSGDYSTSPVGSGDEGLAEATRASGGALEAGASPAAASAAKNAVMAGQDSAEIAKAVQDAGGTPEQGVAAAMSVKSAYPQHIKAATDAMVAGKTPKEVGLAVANAGGSYGASSAAREAAAATTDPRRAASTSDTSHTSGTNEAKAGIGTDQQLNAQQQPGEGSGKKSWLDDLSNLNQHIAQEKTSTHVSINTHHSD